MIGARPVPLAGNLVELTGAPLAGGAGRLGNGGDPFVLVSEVALGVVVGPVQVEQVGALDLAGGDLLGLDVQLLGYRVLARLAGGAHVQRPRVVEGALGEVGGHRLVCLELARQVEPVRLVEAVERGPGAVAGAGRVGQRGRLATLAAVVVEADNAVLRDVEQVGIRALGADVGQGAERQLLDLLHRDGQHGDVRRAHRAAHRAPRGVEPVAAGRPVGVQLGVGEERLFLGLG